MCLPQPGRPSPRHTKAGSGPGTPASRARARGAAHGGPRPGKDRRSGGSARAPGRTLPSGHRGPLGFALVARALAPFPQVPIRRTLGHVFCGLRSLVPPSVLRAFSAWYHNYAVTVVDGIPGCVLGDSPGGPLSPGLLASPDKSALTCLPGYCGVARHPVRPGARGPRRAPSSPSSTCACRARPPGGPRATLWPPAPRCKDSCIAPHHPGPDLERPVRGE